MSQIDELYQVYLGLNDRERFARVATAAERIKEHLLGLDIEQEVKTSFFYSLIGIFLAADKKVSASEADYFNALFNSKLSPQDLASDIGACLDPELIKMVDDIVDGMPDDVKVAVCIFGIGFLSCDGELTSEEKALFEKIIS